MRRLLLIVVAATLAAPVLAEGAAAGSTAGSPSIASVVDIEPATFLPPPPAAGSAHQRAELAELRAIETTRSAADVSAAKSDGDTKNASIFAAAIGPAFDLGKLPATAKLMDVVRATEKAAVDRGKREFRRPRPWIVDPSLGTCDRGNDPLSSYPSGHTSMASAMGAVLARLMPDKARPIMARAAFYGETRIVCEQHFRSDVTGGETLGIVMSERLLVLPAFQAQFATAVGTASDRPALSSDTSPTGAQSRRAAARALQCA